MHALFLVSGRYYNRGCEAIVRGTVAVLRDAFGEPLTVTNLVLGSDSELAWQRARETDSAISHKLLQPEWPRWHPYRIARKVGKTLRRPATPFPSLATVLKSADVALQIGGDNYTLDYGGLDLFLALDTAVLRAGVPLALWGASVGPFGSEPEVERLIAQHLQRFTYIGVREHRSYDYLESIGVSNIVRRATDPAFLLEPEMPAPQLLPQAIVGAPPVGINLSPVLRPFAGQCDEDTWAARCAGFVKAIAEVTERPLLLIPHVTEPGPDDDHALLCRVAELLPEQLQPRVEVASPLLNAGEVKWVLGQCRTVVAARMHAAIGALGGGVPTVMLAYSPKAYGVAQEVYGHARFCIPAGELTDVRLATTVTEVLSQREAIADGLRARKPHLAASALAAGGHLREALEAQTSR